MRKTLLIVLFVIMILALAACALTPNPSDKPNGDDNPNGTSQPVDPNHTNDPAQPNEPNEPNNPVTPDDTDDDKAVVTFNADNGTFADGETSVNVKVDAQGRVTINNDPRLDGHAFAGWYDGSDKFDPSAKFSQNKTFTAKYVSAATDSVYNALFSEKATVSIDINMSDAEWKKLNQDYIDFNNKKSKSPIYRMADNVTLSIDDGNGTLNYYFEEVGVRMKGNTSRHTFYGNDGFFNSVHLKLSFKQTFDDVEDGYKQSELKTWTDQAKRDERKARTLGGMDKIDLKYNSTADETYVRELYAMKMFRDNGIYAPNVTLCSVTALEKNDTHKNLGLYRIHEAVDEAFIERRLNENKVGDLWKCTYNKTGPADMTNYELDKRVGVEDELKGKFYSYDKKTNKKKDKTTGLRDFSSIVNFITALNGDNPDYEKLIDLDYFAKFEAVNYILGNPDCIRNNYNNYYLYFRADGKAIIIPYDYDRCLGITKDWNPTGSANMKVAPYTRTVAATGRGQNNPLYKNLIDKGAPCGDGSVLMRYRQNLLYLANSQGFTANAFNAYKNNYQQRYAQYTATAIATNNLTFDNNKTGNVAYATYITTKLKTLRDNIDNYRA